ncbi:pantetheine-phosphate adenylyltransferase [Marinigracilibium pacificum]|uniref:Phosphopantetheine adenylyltransferase n=1 Tax=Marinigracilibium pacificum TaxID=2729599 RepID=A0A848J5M4_9BACT|nr:pantetheine-phosphate adenylyltransferase [Marinigracilibium pacificum]NMM50548.1 pantetheine-phosphate adenylyltransferase [Marinigracilibium pacificum]
MTKNQKTAIFPGSFDPFTNGHKDIVLRSLKIFDIVVIAIGHNTSKHTRYFDIDLMVGKIKESFTEYGDRVEVVVYNELTAFLAQKMDAKFLIRGLRNTTDFEYENSISQVNADINTDLETIFLITSPEFAAISSTIIREIHRYGADVSKYLPYEI